jgi:hypothetical protein
LGKGDGEGKLLNSVDTGSEQGALDGDEEYLKVVLQEVKKREQRLTRVEQERRGYEAELAKLGADRAAQRGDASVMRSAEAFKRTMRERILKARAEEEEARRDLDKALERKRLMENELKARTEK